MASQVVDKARADRRYQMGDKAREERGGHRTGTTGIPARLHATSAPFEAYIKMQRLPAGATNFDHNSSGYPIVHQGEYICRMPGIEPEKYCGLKTLRKDDLLRHLERAHGFDAGLRLTGGGSGRAQKMAYRSASGFYLHIMRTEEYEGKAQTQGQRVIQE